MSTLQIRIDEKLKADALAVLKELNITPSDACRQFLRYVVENEELPVVMISDDVSDDDNFVCGQG
ncbi:type II toxin-antitoxin system RelB/DinJ family antitoxin [Serratia fonticola]|uniref:Type II toxin-antitoxin system RelB/DinJ family antitoxin n=1 Tax=Serratia fonticola TaxID=47917 RepID=A0ABY9PW18_SERFO|nr:type II toxin-antitoxin system RelB/DinJ family antitoxin [Serratia fonticola]WMT17222.1 type II toxin-antitoxin system RelB/DinJ family antitoxin [Serratia fonticola]WMT17231.1 type II toxin-antitoxin system RelB/DinJ family antitoxin [Serratia fonticola]